MPTILIVDDFREYASLLEKKLNSEGFQTLAAQDGQAGIEMAKKHKPDLILLDIMMPNVGGPEARVELMKDPATKNIPIIFLTGLRAPRPSNKPSPGGVKTIGKSNDFNQLLDAIREVFGKSVKK